MAEVMMPPPPIDRERGWQPETFERVSLDVELIPGGIRIAYLAEPPPIRRHEGEAYSRSRGIICAFVLFDRDLPAVEAAIAERKRGL